jgi:hypothetical protein
VLLASQLFTSCATSDDPREGGFVSGIVGLTTGTYQARIDEKEAVYGSELSDQRRLKAEAERIRRERAAVQANLRSSENRLAGLERAIRQERTALEQEAGSSSATEERVWQLEAAQQRLSSTKLRLTDARRQSLPVSDARVESEIIESELDELDDIVALLGSKQF